MITIVNAVGGSSLERELDLNTVNQNISAYSLTYNGNFSGKMYIKMTENSPTVSLFTSGKYSIAGAESISQLRETNEKIQNMFKDIGAIEEEFQSDINIRYLVGIGDLDREIDLAELSCKLGQEAEYEPEQFPGLCYRPEQSVTFIIFSTGKVSVNGPKSKQTLCEEFRWVSNRIDAYL
jgi:transcription initiation factor TFIID TATA-box-binding protein